MMWLPFYGDGIGFGWMIFGWAMMVVWWVIILVGIFLVLRIVTRGWSGGGRSAADILKERYAKGEITQKQFIEMKKEIRQ